MTNKKKINIFKQKGIHVCLSISFGYSNPKYKYFFVMYFKTNFF